MLPNKELRLIRYGEGVKLISDKTISHGRDLGSLGEFLDLPISFYLLNKKGETELMNETGVEACGFVDPQAALGKSLFEVSQVQSAKNLIGNCITVIKEQSIKIFNEVNQRKDGLDVPFLSYKTPWYNQDNKIVGILGCSIVIGQHDLANSLSLLKETQLFETTYSSPHQLQLNETYLEKLSRRERECALLIVRGFTAKQIAKQFTISHRTVEEYLQTAKIKLTVNNRYELIEKLLS